MHSEVENRINKYLDEMGVKWSPCDYYERSEIITKLPRKFSLEQNYMYQKRQQKQKVKEPKKTEEVVRTDLVNLPTYLFSKCHQILSLFPMSKAFYKIRGKSSRTIESFIFIPSLYRTSFISLTTRLGSFFTALMSCSFPQISFPKNYPRCKDNSSVVLSSY